MIKFFKFRCLTATFFIIFLFAEPVPVCADIYMYIDKDGVMHFTNTPVESEGSAVKFNLYQKEGFRERKHNYFGNIDSFIIEAANYYNVSFPLIKAIIKVESNFNPTAISEKGAMGLMQIMPFNFKELSIRDPFDPWENIMGGVLYFKNMLNKFNGNLSLSLAAYNAGPNAVDKYGSIPPYPETINYVEKVLKYYSLYNKNE
jgi:soluble lytic murein transglycosylase-like protein